MHDLDSASGAVSETAIKTREHLSRQNSLKNEEIAVTASYGPSVVENFCISHGIQFTKLTSTFCRM